MGKVAIWGPDGKVRGEIFGNDFVIRRHRGKHYLRVHAGWGLNSSVWGTVRQRPEIQNVVVVEPDTGDEYRITKSDLMEYEDKGEVETIVYRDEQVVFKEKWFNKYPAAQGRLFDGA